MAGSVRAVIWLVMLGLSCLFAGAQARLSAASCGLDGICGPPQAGLGATVAMFAIDTVNLGTTTLNGERFPNGYAVTLTGDLGLDPSTHDIGCFRAGGEILGGSLLTSANTFYGAPGPRSVTVTVNRGTYGAQWGAERA